MRVTKADLTTRLHHAEDRVRHLQESSIRAAQEIRQLRADRDNAIENLKVVDDATTNAVAELSAQRERDREALLIAENRIVALEDAIVSLAVRVA